MLGDGHFDAALKRRGAQRLDDIAERAGQFGALQSGAVGVRGQEDDGQVVARANLQRRLDSIALAVDANVHQHDLRAGGQLQSLLGRGRRADDLVAQRLQTA